jgi:putative transposase
VDVAVACRVLGASRSGFYEWQQRQHRPSTGAVQDAQLTRTIAEIHTASRGCYGSSRVRAELHLGLGIACGRKRVARLIAPPG